MVDETPPNSELICASAWRRIAAALVDAVIGMSLSFAWLPLVRRAFANKTMVPLVAWDILGELLLLLLIVRFGATPGKFVARVRIVDPTGAFPAWPRAVLRTVPGIIGSVVDTLQLNAAMHAAPTLGESLSFLEFGRLLDQFGHSFTTLEHAVTAFGIVDIGVVLLNRRRRAIHDFLAGTYVVTLESWTRYGETERAAS